MKGTSLRTAGLFLFLLLPFSANSQTAQLQWVTTSDSVRLATDVYLISDGSPSATILIRTAMDRKFYAAAARFFAGRGYNVVVQSTRGRFGSEGADSLFWQPQQNFRADTHTTLKWITEQPWSDGNVGMFGFQDAGYIAYLSASGAPPALKTLYVASAPFDFYRHVLFYHGVLRKELVENWLPKLTGISVDSLLMLRYRYDKFWRPFVAYSRPFDLRIPACHVTGWFDPFRAGTILAFRVFQKEGDPFARQHQRLIIGPWGMAPEGIRQQQGELIFPEDSQIDLLADAARWFDQWLKAKDTGILIEPPVKYFLLGDPDDPYTPGNKWNTADTWPPKHSRAKFYLRGNGLLGFDKREPVETAEGFRFDPANPTPTRGGSNYRLESGPRDQSTIELRPDVLLFTTPPLEEPLAITGPVRLRIFVSSSALDTDFAARLSDVFPDGRSMLLTDGILRTRYRRGLRRQKLLPRKGVVELRIDLGDIAAVFSAGHRIRVAITSSNSPRFEVNPNSPLPFRRHIELQPAVNTLYYGGKKNSYLELPVRIIE